MNVPWRGGVSGLVCALAAWGLSQFSVVQGLEDWMLDGWFRQRGPRATRSQIVIVALDDASQSELQKPLTYLSPELAEVVSYLDEAGAASIGLDLMIPETLGGLEAFEEGNPGDATPLGQAILDSGKVVLAQGKSPGGWSRPLPQWQLKRFLNPEPTDSGFVDLTTDRDNFLRRQQLFVRDEDEAVWSFALALVGRATGSPAAWKKGQLTLGDDPVLLDEEQRLRINFVGPPGQFPVLPFRDVLRAARSHSPLDARIKDSIVIIGTTGRGQQDVHATPFANNYWGAWYTPQMGLMSGSEIHANIAATLIDRAYIVPQTWVTALPMMIIIGVLLGAGLERMNRLRGPYRFLLWSLAAVIAFHFLWKALGFAAFRYWDWRIEILPLLLLGWMVYAGNFIVRWLRLRRILNIVTAATIAEHLETRPDSLGLQGEERLVTMLFADIRGFTTFSEKHTAREVVQFLNTYFKAIVPIMEQHRGILNQYMGDGIMVIFGLEAGGEHHASDAVHAAVEAVACIEKLREQNIWTEEDFPDMRIGVGIHTGAALVGTIGTRQRLNYTAIGDVVNTASRIESETKKQKQTILISEETFRALKTSDRQAISCEPLPETCEVKGKNQRLQLYAVRPRNLIVPETTP